MRPSLPVNGAAGAAFEPLWREASIAIERGGYFPCAPDWSLPEQVRPHYQVWLIERGSATLVVEGRSLALDPGIALMVPPHTRRHGWHDPADPLHCYVFSFAVRVLGAAAPNALVAVPARFRPAPERWTALLATAAEVERELQGELPGHTLLVNAAMARLVGLLWREVATRHALDAGGPFRAGTVTRERGETVSRLAPVFAFIAAHFGERVTLAQLAQLAHLSPAHFSTTFRRVTGLSPFQYLHRYRLQHAKELLGDRDASVAQVASTAGFPDPFYFARAFKRSEGLSPTQYRQAKESPGIP